MSRSRRTGAFRPAPPKKSSYTDLVHVPDVASTAEAPLRATDEVKAYKREEDVEPPFIGEGGHRFISRQEFGLAYKVTAIICGLFLTVGVPLVWFASRMDSRVEVVQEEVKSLKARTDELNSRSIEHDLKLEGLEKLTSEFSRPSSHESSKKNEPPSAPINTIHRPR